MLPGAREVEGVPAVVNERVDRPDQAVDRPSFTRLWDIPDRPMDPAMFEGRHMTVWLRQAYERSRAIERAEAGAWICPSGTTRRPGTCCGDGTATSRRTGSGRTPSTSRRTP